MREKTKELVAKIGTDTSGKWIYHDRIDDLIQLVVAECIIAVEEASKSATYTTYDAGVAASISARAIIAIQDKFKE